MYCSDAYCSFALNCVSVMYSNVPAQPDSVLIPVMYCLFIAFGFMWVECVCVCILNGCPGRYIEVFRSSESEVRPYKSGGRPTPYMRPGEGGFVGGGTLGGDKYGSGYERSYRGRGGGGRGRGVGYGGGGGGDGGIFIISSFLCVCFCFLC